MSVFVFWIENEPDSLKQEKTRYFNGEKSKLTDWILKFEVLWGSCGNVGLFIETIGNFEQKKS